MSEESTTGESPSDVERGESLNRDELKLNLPTISDAPSQRPLIRRKPAVETIIFQKKSVGAPVELSRDDETFSPLEGSFKMNDKIAEGGQGEIHHAADLTLKRHVVLKSLKASHMSHPEIKQAFLDEARLTAQLDHPSIIPVYSLNQDEADRPSFSMKFVNGMTLDRYIELIVETYNAEGIDSYDERMSLSNRLECFLKICDAMTYAHSKGVIHQDLKPPNIMIGEFNEVCVMDWGVARVMDNEEHKNSEQVVGTPGYIDPRSVDDPSPNTQVDVYALGVILYKLVTLRNGVLGQTQQEIICNMLQGEQPKVCHRFPKTQISPDLAAIIDKARSPHRETRYGSVHDLAGDIRRFLNEEEVTCRPDNLPRRIVRKIHRHLYQTVMIGLTLIILLAGVAIYSLYSQNQVIRRAKVRELTLTQFQARVGRQAHVLDSHFLHLAHLLHRLGDKMSWSLDHDPARTSTIYSVEAYDSPDAKPPGTVSSPACKKEINLEQPVYKLAPGVKLDDVSSEVITLFGLKNEMLDTQLRSSFDYHPDKIPALKKQVVETGLPIMWIYAGFEKGYFASFPGKGGYPKDYDPRKRPWYDVGKREDGIHWGTPYFDINGLGLVLPCLYPMINSKNEFIGVVALDVTVDYVISTLMESEDSNTLSIIEKTVLDSEGKILVSTRQRTLDEKNAELVDGSLKLEAYPEDDVLSTVLTQKRGQLTRIENGIEYVYAFSTIHSLNWYYLEKVVSPETAALSE